MPHLEKLNLRQDSSNGTKFLLTVEALLHKSSRAAVQVECEENDPHERASKAQVPNHQLERLQRGADGARLPAYLTRQEDMLGRQCQA